MPLSTKSKVTLPKTGVTVRGSGKYRYVYKVLRTYRNDKRQPTNDRVAIGRLDAESGMLIPNDNYWKYYGDTAIEILPAYDSIRSIGTAFFVTSILSSLGITRMLENALGTPRAKEAATAALYIAARGNVFDRVLDFCEGYTLCETPLTARKASALFSSITYEERMTFFRAWAASQEAGSYFAYDVTSFSTYAEGIADTEWGYNRDGDRLPQINLGCYMSQQSGLPIFYVTYPGSILDKSHLPYMMAYNKDLGINDVGFVMDKGFCSTANVNYMSSERLPFVMGVETRHKTTKAAIASVRDGIVSMRNRAGQGIYARVVHSRFYGVTSALHVYHDPSLGERQRRDLFRTVESQEEALAQSDEITEREAKRYSAYFVIERAKDGTFTFERNYDKIDAIAQNNGFFCLLTTTGMTSSEVLSIYRRRDMIEKNFDDLKNHMDMKRLHTHTKETTDGKLFLAFISLIAVSEMGVKLAEMMKERSWSKGSVITELEKIRVVIAAGGKRLMNPVTKTQRLIFEALGLGVNDLNSYITNTETNTRMCSKLPEI